MTGGSPEEVEKPEGKSWKLGTEKLPIPTPRGKEDDDDDEPIRGTGGTALAQFLKLCKTRTVGNLLGSSSK